MFDEIIGHTNVKKLLLRVLESEKKINVLLLGTPATAKTLFLLKLSELKDTLFVTHDMTKAGLLNLLVRHKPKVLLIDQIDYCTKGVYELLNDLMEYGIITKTVFNYSIRIELDTKVIATANKTKRIPQNLLSRFMIVKLKPYSEKEYIAVCKKILPKYCKDEKIINKIIEETKEARDIRKAIQLAQVCKTEEEVEIFRKIIVLR